MGLRHQPEPPYHLESGRTVSAGYMTRAGHPLRLALAIAGGKVQMACLGADVARLLDLLERPTPVAELEAVVGGWPWGVAADEARHWLHRILDGFAARGLVMR